MDKLYIVIPAYNEEENIEKVIDEWHSVIEKMSSGSRLVIIDDGSRDNTYKIMCNLKSKYKKLIPLTKKNEGHGQTILYGYKYAISKKADFIFQTDSDRQTDPSEFEKFWELRDNYAMVIGNRCNRQDGLSRKFVMKVLRFILFLIFHVRILDANTPFRLMKADILKEKIKLVPNDSFLTNVNISAIYIKDKLPVKYLKIKFGKREKGVNSLNFKKIIGVGINSISEFRNVKRNLKKEKSVDNYE